jgi:hypothetical protein
VDELAASGLKWQVGRRHFRSFGMGKMAAMNGLFNTAQRTKSTKHNRTRIYGSLLNTADSQTAHESAVRPIYAQFLQRLS